MKPTLVKIDLRKCKHVEGSVDGVVHDDIDVHKGQYLVKVYGQWCAGTFSLQWYGLSFDGWGESGIELKKNTKHGISEVYKIVARK